MSTRVIRVPAQPDAEIDRWCERVAGFRDRLARADHKKWHARLPRPEDALNAGTVTVAFGGWQKSGKSSLVNAALGRSILSVDDLPETGTICRITAGAADGATAYKNGKASPIQAGAEALRQVTAIQPGTTARAAADLVDRVELTLRGVPIPERVVWIDAPGMDDRKEMTDRALEAAAQADVVLFVTPSLKPLTDSETRFLSEHVAAHGPASVVLVVNAFLGNADTAEQWDDFQSRKVPFFKDRVAERSAQIGFTKQAPAAIYPVSARALATANGAFGGVEFMELLLGIRSPRHPRVRRTRVYRLGRRLAELEGLIRERAAEVAERLRREAGAAAAAHEAARVAHERFVREAAGHAGAFVSTLAERLRSAGRQVRDTVSGAWDDVSVPATVRYDARLKVAASTATSEAARALADAVGRSAQSAGLAPPDGLAARAQSAVGELAFNVSGGQDIASIGEGMVAAAAAAGGAAGIWFFGIGGILGAAAAGAAAQAARESKQAEAAAAARAAIQASIDANATAATAAVTAKRAAIEALVVAACGPAPTPPAPNAALERELQELNRLAQESGQLWQEARALAGAGE